MWISFSCIKSGHLRLVNITKVENVLCKEKY